MTNHSAYTLSTEDAAKLAAQVAQQYLPSAQSRWFDPFGNLDHFLVAIVFICLVLFVLCYWRTLLSWVSEDNVLRCDRFCLQYWFFLQCCGLCDGEWTRCVSTFCCFCCPEIRGRNLKRTLGEWLGISPVAVRVQNIMLGGLPRCQDSWFMSRSPDIYVQILPDELQPTLNTEVITQANIDCVQFTSGFTLLVKNNLSEDPVRICVREMRMVGSRDIADCYVCPTRLISWARRGKKIRIRLSPLPGQNDPMRTPWILLDLSIPGELTYLRSATDSFHPIIMESRTAGAATGNNVFMDGSEEESLAEFSRDPGGSPLAACIPGQICMCHGGDGAVEPQQPLVLLPVQRTSDYKMYKKADDFVATYPLLNEKGLKVKETEDLLGGESMRFRGYVRNSLCALVVFGIVYGAGHFVTTTCFEEYRQMQVVERYSEYHNVTFSDPDWYYDNHERVKSECKFARMDISKWASNVMRHKLVARMVKSDLGIDESEKTRDIRRMCHPEMEETLRFCQSPSNLTNGMQPQIFQMLSCHPIFCEVDLNLQEWDFIVFILGLSWGIMVCVGRACVNNKMRQTLERPSAENFWLLWEHFGAAQPHSGRREAGAGQLAPEAQNLLRTPRRVGFGRGMSLIPTGGRR